MLIQTVVSTHPTSFCNRGFADRSTFGSESTRSTILCLVFYAECPTTLFAVGLEIHDAAATGFVTRVMSLNPPGIAK